MWIIPLLNAKKTENMKFGSHFKIWKYNLIEKIHVEMILDIKNSVEIFKWKATPREFIMWKVEY